MPKIFQKFKNLICASSNKKHGDLKKDIKRRNEFLKSLEILPQDFVFLKQVHSAKIRIVKKPQKIILKGDGLITKEKNVALGIFSADCVPVFLYDPKKEIVGVLHAGWRGTFEKIVSKAISIFKKLKSDPKDILVYVGPSICGNCYVVEKERAGLFQKKFSDFEKKFLKFKKGRYFLDLRKLNKILLEKEGVLAKNIQISPVCTFSNKNYFSFRREKGKLKGEMLSVICQK